MKRLVLYYSYEGNTKIIAETIAKELHADIDRLIPVNEMESTGFSKYVWGGAKVFMKKQPKLIDLSLNPKDYDEIFVGTPVWAFTYSPAIRTLFLSEYLSNKKVYFFCTHEGGMGKTIEKAKKLISEKNTFVEAIDFKNVKTDLENQQRKAVDWIKSL